MLPPDLSLRERTLSSDPATTLDAMSSFGGIPKVSFEPKRIYPVPAQGTLTEALQRISLATFRACRCNDYARVGHPD